jgi:hypothetical protein
MVSRQPNIFWKENIQLLLKKPYKMRHYNDYLFYEQIKLEIEIFRILAL